MCDTLLWTMSTSSYGILFCRHLKIQRRYFPSKIRYVERFVFKIVGDIEEKYKLFQEGVCVAICFTTKQDYISQLTTTNILFYNDKHY